MTLNEEINDIEAKTAALEERKREIYRQSIEAPDDEKACENWIAEMLARPERPHRKHEPWLVEHVAWADGSELISERRGSGYLVKVRPCDKELEGKTFLGIYLGEVALSIRATYKADARTLGIEPTMHNPAMWVPALGRVIYGCGSWWGRIKTEADLQEITEADIDSVWYVQALRSIKGKENTQ
jgi:hypothetical protein